VARCRRIVGWPAGRTPGGFTGGTATFGGGAQTPLGVGLNGYPNLNMEFMLHVVVYTRNSSGHRTTVEPIDWIAGRAQLIF